MIPILPTAKEAKMLSKTNKEHYNKDYFNQFEKHKQYFFPKISKDIHKAIEKGETHVMYLKDDDDKDLDISDYILQFYTLYLKNKGYKYTDGYSYKHSETKKFYIYWSDEEPEELKYYS